ncbi:MAG: alpha-L-fucosidase [Verrucomicrobiae bacterium]
MENINKLLRIVVLVLACLSSAHGQQGQEPSTAAELAGKKSKVTYDVAADARRKSAMSPEALAWENVLEQNLGDFYLPLYKKDKLAGKETAWDYVNDDPKLPRVLLVGDSISRGYKLTVRHDLAGKANVHRAPANCGPTAKGLKDLSIWLGDGQWEVIHFNFGIHDRTTPASVYAANLEQIVAKLQTGGAKLIWARTTPPASGENNEKFSPEQCEQVNRIADDIMQRHAIPEDDLYSLVQPRLAEWQLPHNVHFKDEGYEALGHQVAKEILALLPMITARETKAPMDARMVWWRDLKYGMFLHFGMSTFTGKEIDAGNQPSTTYAPIKPDPDQWIRVAKEAGMKYAVLTAKHVSGHCLWDSKVRFRGQEYDYDVATSGNTNDVVRAFVNACKKYSIVPGLYYCLFDSRNNSVKPSEQWQHFKLPDDFFQLAKDQLTELARNYPTVRYYWIDIPRAASQEQRTALYGMLRRENPGCVVLFNCGLLKKHKNNNGSFTVENTGGESWPTDVLNSERDVIQGVFNPVQTWQGTNYYLGYEHCDVVGNDWFWTAGDKARSTDKLYELYHDTVIRAGGNLLLDVGPNRDGKLEQWQIKALQALKHRIEAEAKTTEKLP